MSSSLRSFRSLLVPPFAAIFVAAALPAPAAGQEPPAETYFDRVDVEIANVEVFVTDSAGRPVTDLGRDDFTLFVDGEPTEIRNFHAAAATAPLEAPPSAVAGEAMPDESPPPAVAPPPEQAVTLVILVDNRHVTPGERKRALERLGAHFAGGLPPSTRAMVATLDGGIVVRQPLTADGTAIAAALEELEDAGARGYGEFFELRNLLRQIEEAESGNEGPGAGGDVLFAIRNFEERERSDLQYSLEQVARLIASLGGMPGHKALLYVGRGLNSAPGRALLAAFSQGASNRVVGSNRPVISELELAASPAATVPGFQRLAELSNANRVSFYAVSTGATGTSPLFGEVNNYSGSWSAAIDAVYRSDLAAGLAILADETGGRSLSGGAKYDLVADWIAADAGHFYSLGFTPPPAQPGAAHRIEVRVPGRDVEVRHRRRLVTASRQQRAEETTLAALLYGGGDNRLGIAAEPGAPQPGEGGMVVQPILVKVPFHTLVLLPGAESYDGELSIHLATADAEGRYSEVSTISKTVSVPAEQIEMALTGVAGYRVGLLVRPGPQKLAVAVRDVVGDVLSLVVLDLDVEPPAGGRGRRGR